MDRDNKMDSGVLRGLFDSGLMGIDVSAEYGGVGAGFTSSIVAIEELAKVDPGVSVCCDVQNTLVNNFFSNFSSAAHKEKYLTRLATTTLGSFCLSEESSGSDAFALKCRATEAKGGYVLDGTKLWITNAGEAEIFLVMANVDPSKGYKGITCFIVEKGMGVQLGQKEDKLGIRASSTHPVILENVFVPKENVLGQVGLGYKYAIESLNEGRIGIAAQMLGLAQGCLDATMPYLDQRKQFGTVISDFQGFQHQIAEVHTRVEAARLLVYNAARLKATGRPFVKEASMAKLYASEVADLVTSKCVEWAGGVGFMNGFPAAKFYRDVKIGAIYEGTSFIQKSNIAKCLAAERRK
jgi:short/branched chain acyl-CoA dehydrogenase